MGDADRMYVYIDAHPPSAVVVLPSPARGPALPAEMQAGSFPAQRRRSIQQSEGTMKISGNAVRPGNIIEHQGRLWRAVKIMHTQPGKGGAYLQVELKDIRDGTKLNERFRSSENVERVRLDQRSYQYLYGDGDTYTFMDTQTFDQV